jgi:hypothetical protein
MRVLAEHLDVRIRASTDALIAIHGLEGRAAAEVQARLRASVTTESPVHEGKAAMLGGALSGALSGLVADLAAGGLTLGAGMLAGGVVGALGAAGLAHGYNIARGTTETTVRWSDQFLDGLVSGALLRYLAVAHYGRGRGAWSESEYPAFWRDVVGRGVAAQRTAFAQLWRERSDDSAAFEARLEAALRRTALAVLDELYPGAREGGASEPDAAPGEDAALTRAAT